MQVSTVRTVDNAILNLDVGDVGPEALHSWTGHVRYTPRYGGRDTTADVWALELAPKSALAAGVASVGGRERERFALNGGEVVIYDCADPSDARWAVWIGPWNIAHALFYAPSWEARDVVEMFGRVQWNDTPEGLTATPGRRFNLQRAVYLLTIAGVGTMQVEPKALASAKVPKWRGYNAPAGEIWRMPSTDGPLQETMLMVNDSAVVTLSPWDAPLKGLAENKSLTAATAGAGTLETAAQFLTKLNSVRWGA